MIYQAGIELNVKDREVRVNLDFDTGLIGFSEMVNGNWEEYNYQNSPMEFKQAFLKKFEALFAKDQQLNLKISRKNPETLKALQILFNNK